MHLRLENRPETPEIFRNSLGFLSIVFFSACPEFGANWMNSAMTYAARRKEYLALDASTPTSVFETKVAEMQFWNSRATQDSVLTFASFGLGLATGILYLANPFKGKTVKGVFIPRIAPDGFGLGYVELF